MFEYSITGWRTPVGEWMEVLYRLTFRREWIPEIGRWRDVVVKQEKITLALDAEGKLLSKITDVPSLRLP